MGRPKNDQPTGNYSMRVPADQVQSFEADRRYLAQALNVSEAEGIRRAVAAMADLLRSNPNPPAGTSRTKAAVDAVAEKYCDGE